MVSILTNTSMRSASGKLREIPRASVYAAGIVLFALALRLYHLGSESLWIDEGFSLRDAADFSFFRETRPLFFLILSNWMKLGLGHSELMLRLPAAIFGALGVWALYAVGRRLLGTQAALMSAALMSLSVLHMNHSREIRWYSLLACLTLTATYFLILSLERKRARYIVAYALFGLAMLLTFPLTVFVLAAHGLFLLLYAKAYRPAGPALIGILLAILAVWTPWLRNNMQVVHGYSEGYTSIIDKPTPISAMAMMGRFFLWKWYDPGRLQAMGALGFSAIVTLLAVYGLKGIRRADPGLALIGIWLAVPLAAMAVFSYRIANVWTPSYLITVSPAFYLLVSRGILSIRPRYVAGMAGLVVVAITIGRLGMYLTRPVRPEWRQTVAYVQAHERPGDIIGIYYGGSQHVFRYYYTGRSKLAPLGGEDITGEHFSGWNDRRVGDLFKGFPLKGNRLWLVMSSHTYAGGFTIIDYVKRHYRVLEHHNWFNTEVYLFDANGRQVP